MPRASCRCGMTLTIPRGGNERIVCPKCGARVRVRHRADSVPSAESDGFRRFLCPCGRRLKVNTLTSPKQGKCPECGRIVPIPDKSIASAGNPETPTAELEPADRAVIAEWTRRHLTRSRTGPDKPALHIPPGSTSSQPTTPVIRSEAGLRVCPTCGKPIHLGADSCRACGTSVPRR